MTGNQTASRAIREFFLKGHAPGVPVAFDEPMKRHTSLGIGGPAAAFARPADAAALEGLIMRAAKANLPVFYLGGGTNLLAGDGPANVLVIATEGIKGMDVLEAKGDSVVVNAAAGESLKGLLSFCQQNGYSGLEGLVGIPGSVGGAVWGNAGSYGAQMNDALRSVTVIRGDGKMERFSAGELEFGYRSSPFKEGGPLAGALIASVELGLIRQEPAAVSKKMNEFFLMKRKTQPLGERSAGCVFKNPEGLSAGKLIEEAGLKGARAGAIEVSPVHANFFVNRGGGTAADFLRLMDAVVSTVKKNSGIILEPEIRILRDDSD